MTIGLLPDAGAGRLPDTGAGCLPDTGTGRSETGNPVR